MRNSWSNNVFARKSSCLASCFFLTTWCFFHLLMSSWMIDLHHEIVRWHHDDSWSQLPWWSTRDMNLAFSWTMHLAGSCRNLPHKKGIGLYIQCYPRLGLGIDNYWSGSCNNPNPQFPCWSCCYRGGGASQYGKDVCVAQIPGGHCNVLHPNRHNDWGRCTSSHLSYVDCSNIAFLGNCADSLLHSTI